MHFIDGAVARVPVHTPTPSGGFVAEGGAIPVGALIIAALGLKPKKAGSITAITKELAAGGPLNVERSLRILLAQDLGLAIDAVLLSNAVATSAAPAGLLNGVTPLTATAGGGTNALLGDIKKLVAAISPAVRPVIIANSVQAASIGILSQSPLPVIAAPYFPADQIVAVDAAAFASSLGVPDFSTDENPTVHMESVPSAISTPGSPNVVSAGAIAVANRGHRFALPDRMRLDAAAGGCGFDDHRRHLVSAMPTAARQLHLFA
jgi:hypothetical protein